MQAKESAVCLKKLQEAREKARQLYDRRKTLIEELQYIEEEIDFWVLAMENYYKRLL